jgi:cardiolipin synthase (CMP-forming)
MMLRQLGSTPNLLTLLRLAFIPFIVIFILDGEYKWATALLVIAGLSDGFDGLLARLLKQKTTLGQYLDPIADKLLLSTLFLVLSFVGQIPWRVTVMVFSRDLIILVVCAVLYATNTTRDFSPSIYGKINTVAQIAAVFFVMLSHVVASPLVSQIAIFSLGMTVAFTIFSGFHYVFAMGLRIRAGNTAPPA